MMCPSLQKSGYRTIPGDDLCQQFQKQARQTWQLLHKARRHGRQLLEDTLTDLHLLNFSTLISPGFAIRSFSKRQERKTAADWEWWFRANTGFGIGLRVQAKVIDLSTDTYPHLHYRYSKAKGSLVFQADQLIHSALSGHPRKVPLYCLYTHWAHRRFGRRHPTAGCMLLSPLLVKAYQSKGVAHLDNLIAHMMPWHCIVCCPQARGPDFPSRILSMAKRVLIESAADLLQVSEQPPDNLIGLLNRIEPTEDMPDYVAQIADGGSPLLDDPDLGFVTVFTQTAG